MRRLALLLLISLPLAAQSPTAPDPFHSLHFLEGTWTAMTQATNAQGASGATLSGRYTFARELDGHVLARHSSTDPTCKAPATFDCKHGDLLYIYPEFTGPNAASADQPLHAIYFDNEGHTIHYTLSTPTPTSVIFLSDPIGGVRFRLLYDLQGATLSGKFQVQPPGQAGWHSYLEWSGTRQ